jgi:metallopeptidase MepB
MYTNRNQGYEHPDGTKHYPSTMLLAAFPSPTPTKPTLLRQRNIKTTFHELGHGIHDLVGWTRFTSTSGTAVAQDFVEIPSKMLENWCWNPSILNELSRHYSYLSPECRDAWQAGNHGAKQPPEKAPMELLSTFTATRNMRGAAHMRNLLASATFDMVIHGAKSVEEAEDMDLGRIYQCIQKEVTGLCGVEVNGGEIPGAEHAKIEHYFQGYDAGLYSYVV